MVRIERPEQLAAVGRRGAWTGRPGGSGRRTRRVIRPIAVAYFVQAMLTVGWCELRRDYRHFRTDRMERLSVLDETYSDEGGQLLQRWQAQTATKLAGDAAP